MGVRSKIIEISRKVPETEDLPAVPLSNSEDELVLEEPRTDYFSGENDAELEFASANNEEYWEEEPVAKRSWLSLAGTTLLIAAMVGWTGFVIWAHWNELLQIPAPTRIASLIGLWALPLALLGVIWLLAMRNSYS
jgi:hypothetical protein